MGLSQTRGGVGAYHAITLNVQDTLVSAIADGTVNPTSAAVYPTADLAIYIPVRVKHSVVVRKMAVSNGSAVAGNVDLGIFDAAGTKRVSTGLTAQSGTTTEQVIDVTDTTLGPGLYYLAVTATSASATMYRDANAAPIPAANGVLTQQLGAGAALPATATWVVPQTLAYVPLIAAMLEATAA